MPDFIPYYEEFLDNNFKGEMLLIPIGARTYAGANGKDVYVFDTEGGWSTMEPYLAGLYALACQVNPDITPEVFWKTALQTGDVKEVTRGEITYPARLLNPVKLIESLQAQ
jgi:hypothetical protein